MEDKKKKRYHYQYSLTINNEEKEIELWEAFNKTADQMYHKTKPALLLAMKLYIEKYGEVIRK